MMFASFQKKYFLSDKGMAGVKRGIVWTTITNLVVMAGMFFLFAAMASFVSYLAGTGDVPDIAPFALGLVVFFVVLFISNWQQYNNTYCVFYEECGNQRNACASCPFRFSAAVIWPTSPKPFWAMFRRWSTLTAMS